MCSSTFIINPLGSLELSSIKNLEVESYSTLKLKKTKKSNPDIRVKPSIRLNSPPKAAEREKKDNQFRAVVAQGYKCATVNAKVVVVEGGFNFHSRIY